MVEQDWPETRRGLRRLVFSWHAMHVQRKLNQVGHHLMKMGRRDLAMKAWQLGVDAPVTPEENEKAGR